MKSNFKCPRCKTKQKLGKHLHASWQCPHCHNTIVPNIEDKLLGYRPFKYNSMYKMFSTARINNNFKRTFNPKFVKNTEI